MASALISKGPCSLLKMITLFSEALGQRGGLSCNSFLVRPTFKLKSLSNLWNNLSNNVREMFGLRTTFGWSILTRTCSPKQWYSFVSF